MPRGKPGSGTTTPRARSGTSAVTALGYRGTATAHNWWALPLGNGFDYLIADGGSGFAAVTTMEQMFTIVSDILMGNFAPIGVQLSATALANRSVPQTRDNAIPANGEIAETVRKRVRSRVSGSRAPVTAGT